MKVWVKRGVFFLVAFLVYAAVHGYRENNNPYSHASQESFVSGCERGGVNEDMCRCTFAWIKQNVPAADFKAYAHLVSSPGYTAAQTPPWVDKAIASCRPVS